MSKEETVIEEGEKLAIHPMIASASTARIYSAGSFGELNISKCVSEMLTLSKQVNQGKLRSVEDMLFGQAIALNAMFGEFARRAALTERTSNAELYLRTALKAQSQCRVTLQTLAEIKNPRPVAFVKQANIAQGHQQINNGQERPARAGKHGSAQNELLQEMDYGERLD